MAKFNLGIGIDTAVGGGLPSPDALFDTRTGLVLSDSVGGLTANINYFPATNIVGADGQTLPPSIYFDKTIANGGSFTSITMLQVINCGTTSSLVARAFGGSQNQRWDFVATNKIRWYMANATQGNIDIPDVANIATNWYLIVQRYDSANTAGYFNIYKMGNAAVTASDTYSGAITGGTTKISFVHHLTINTARIAMFGYWESFISTSDIEAIVNSMTFPSATPAIFKVFGGDSLYSRTFYEQVDGIVCWIGNAGVYDTATNIPKQPYMEYVNNPFGGKMLYDGYTKRGNFHIGYKPNGVKGSFTNADDIEHLSSGCIHNLANSYVNFSSLTDATIKAIFDKSNRTYWKATIETESHYIDAGGGYYGIWHPSQLNREFIELHAQSGHENHIFPGLRLNSGIITGITQIPIFKTNVS